MTEAYTGRRRCTREKLGYVYVEGIEGGNRMFNKIEWLNRMKEKTRAHRGRREIF